ncbi:MAG: ROK family protein [Clostridia bacterium]|nr:ROK family protein [Clostridia bacterium]
MSRCYLIMDIGGTKTTGALFTEDGKIVDDYTYVARSQTFKGEKAVYKNTKDVLNHIIEKFHIDMDDVLGIGVGCPGPLDTKAGVIIHAPMMKWINFPLVKRLKEDFKKPVALDNDGNLGALAEQRCGQAQGLKHVMYMTVSTGCGGGILINGDIYHGKNDGALEVGHISIEREGLQCPCGNKGCFELYASGTAMNRRLKEDMKKNKKSLVFELAGYDEEKIEGSLLTEAAKHGDGYAIHFLKQEGYFLGVGVANLFNAFDPDVLVLGGGVTKAKAFFHEEMMRVAKSRCLHTIHEDSIRYSIMNDKVVLYGAYHLIKEHLNK